MWEMESKEITTGVTKYKIVKDGVYISFNDWIYNIKNSTEFINLYIETLRRCHYEAYFWEVKPVNKSRINEDFEFVIVESKTLLKIEANDNSFKKYFEDGEEITTFPNLGGDAQLVVPAKTSESSNYNHLATFIRKAPETQVVNFWKKIGIEYEKLIGVETKWLSTAGLGVYWLHVRIDSRPKYYRYNNYKSLN